MNTAAQLPLDFTKPIIRPPLDCPAAVATLFESLTLQAIGAGIKRYSADAILHRIRWFEQVERGNREFVCNNDWTAGLARWFMALHPEHGKFFETRQSPRKKADA